MDPNETLRQLRKLVMFVLEDDTEPFQDLTEKAESLATFFDALDDWLKGGGFLPTAWQSELPDTAPAGCQRCGAPIEP